MKKETKSSKWFKDNVGYDHFKRGNEIEIDNKIRKIARVSIVKGQLEIAFVRIKPTQKDLFAKVHSTNEITTFQYRWTKDGIKVSEKEGNKLLSSLHNHKLGLVKEDLTTYILK